MSVQKSSERLLCEKEYVWNPSTCACKIDKYQKSITGNSVVICDEIIKPARWENFRILNYCGLLKMVELIIEKGQRDNWESSQFASYIQSVPLVISHFRQCSDLQTQNEHKS